MEINWHDLHTWGDFSALLTCIFVVVGYVRYETLQYLKFRKLSNHLKNSPGIIHTSYNIAAATGLTEDEMLQISSRHNKHIGRKLHIKRTELEDLVRDIQQGLESRGILPPAKPAAAAPRKKEADEIRYTYQ